MVVGGWAKRFSGVNSLTHNGHGKHYRYLQVLVSLMPLLSASSTNPQGSTCVNKYDSHSLLFRPLLRVRVLALALALVLVRVLVRVLVPVPVLVLVRVPDSYEYKYESKYKC